MIYRSRSRALTRPMSAWMTLKHVDVALLLNCSAVVLWLGWSSQGSSQIDRIPLLYRGPSTPAPIAYLSSSIVRDVVTDIRVRLLDTRWPSLATGTAGACLSMLFASRPQGCARTYGSESRRRARLRSLHSPILVHHTSRFTSPLTYSCTAGLVPHHQSLYAMKLTQSISSDTPAVHPLRRQYWPRPLPPPARDYVDVMRASAEHQPTQPIVR